MSLYTTALATALALILLGAVLIWNASPVGAIARACGKPDAAIASIRRATEEARAQGAGWLELLALTELCEREAASAEDRRALVALTEQLAEAGGTPALARARALLAGAESA